MVITGDAFVEKLNQYAPASQFRNLLEIGPGYGRLLSSIYTLDRPFDSYTGIDISEENAAALRRLFVEPGVRIAVTDVEALTSEGPYDLAFSSLTFKHLYPSFEAALRALKGCLRPGGLVIFDLLEAGSEAKSQLGSSRNLVQVGLGYLWPSGWSALVATLRVLARGIKGYFGPDGAYVRWYTRPEVQAILDRVGLELVAARRGYSCAG